MKRQSDVRVEVIAKDCYWIKSALSFEEQSGLVKFIESRVEEKMYMNSSAMIPSPKTLPLGKDGPCAKFTRGDDDDSVVNAFVKGSAEILRKKMLHVSGKRNICQYKNISAAAIRYASPDGRFPPHIDHCDGSFVFLASLGRTARFMMKSPKMEHKKIFAFQSGDVLVFDPSSKAAILHAVEGIEKEASETGKALENAHPGILKAHRIGLQCRVFFEAK
eukprot:g2231.t1